MDQTPTPPSDPDPSGALPVRPAEPLDPVNPAQTSGIAETGNTAGSITNPSATRGCATCGQPVQASATGAMSGCATCGQPVPGERFTAAQGGFVYAIGRVSPQFQSLDVEKEFSQLAADLEAPEPSEHHRLKAVLEQDDKLYLAHHVCWVFAAQGIDSFAIVPWENNDARQLVEAFVPASEENVVNVVVGRPAATPPLWDWSSSGLRLVSADQLLTFTLDEFLDALDSADDDGDTEGRADGDRRAAMRELFFRLTRRAENQGLTDIDRALNYAALRYPPLYRATLQALDNGKALIGVEARPAPASDRRLVSVRLVFRERHTQIVERYNCTIDVTGEFCFLGAPLSPTYE
jgi:hypothetical protein